MVGDAKRAVAWFETHAAEYGVDPERVVLFEGPYAQESDRVCETNSGCTILVAVDQLPSGESKIPGAIQYAHLMNARLMEVAVPRCRSLANVNAPL